MFIYGSNILDTVHVIESKASNNYIDKNLDSGKIILNENDIKSLPKGNGNINEILIYLPAIQKGGTNAASSLNAGELEPQNISISGGAFYQNNFMIDGLSNNSLLDPANNNVYNINDVKGHPQEIFIDTDMVKSITVYDSDIPAKYGRFTGGVVDTKTKHAISKFGAKLRYRHTSDKFTNFFVNDVERFKTSRDANKMQPKFKKDFYSLALNIPIDEENAIYVNISKKTSIIPITHLLETKSEKRVLDNYMIKYSKYLQNGDIVDFTFNYSPYVESRFRPDVKNSNFSIKGGGIKAYIYHERDNENYKIETKIGYSHSKNKRTAPQHYYKWASSDTFPWGGQIGNKLSYIGGFGDLYKTQNIATLKSDINIKGVFDLGFEIQSGNAVFHRPEDSSMYQVEIINSTPTNNGIANLICLEADGCVENEQYSNTKRTYHKFKADVEVVTCSAYIEKEFKIKNFTTRLGLRYDYNNYMNNHDFAYRNKNSYDIFGDKSSILSIGFNRYYANSFLTYKLREAKKPYITYTRALLGKVDAQGEQYVTPGEWEESSRRGVSKTKYSDLKTPYSDEKTISLVQKLFNGKLLLKYVQRDKKNGFSKSWGEIQPDGYRYYTLTNKGFSKYTSKIISYDTTIGNHTFKISTNIAKRTTSNITYDKDIKTDRVDTSKVFLIDKGYTKLIRAEEIPTYKETDPKIIKLIYTYKYNNNFNINTFIEYKTKYKKFEIVGQEIYSYYNPVRDRYEWRSLDKYKLIKYDSTAKVDLSLTYRYKLNSKNKIIFKIDIKNIFNSKTKVYTNKNKFELGRQFWFEVGYKF